MTYRVIPWMFAAALLCPACSSGDRSAPDAAAPAAERTRAAETAPPYGLLINMGGHDKTVVSAVYRAVA